MGDRSNRDDPLRVHLRDVSVMAPIHISTGKTAYKGVGPEVVGLDMVKVRGVLERGIPPVQPLHPSNTRSESVYGQTRNQPTC